MELTQDEGGIKQYEGEFGKMVVGEEGELLLLELAHGRNESDVELTNAGQRRKYGTMPAQEAVIQRGVKSPIDALFDDKEKLLAQAEAPDEDDE